MDIQDFRSSNAYYPFTTCRKFKGLEDGVIILVDIDAETILRDEDRNLYVGASRAKYELAMIAIMSENECEEVISQKELFAKENFEKAIATSYNSKVFQMDK